MDKNAEGSQKAHMKAITAKAMKASKAMKSDKRLEQFWTRHVSLKAKAIKAKEVPKVLLVKAMKADKELYCD